MTTRTRLYSFRNPVAQFDHVLRVFENRQPFAMLVRSDAFQPLEHFISFEGDSALRCMRARKDRAPNRVSMQDRSSTHAAHNGEMKQGFGGRSAITADNI